ncbi:hypothetical protein THOB06_260058 [Vibrio rotiferianus]|nr:hypothetical protein THOG10_260058 [Vibrio rotiferianus]CAH1579426.1 hypothetical protein THOB06_260058 [Vibrio rotiferianus]
MMQLLFTLSIHQASYQSFLHNSYLTILLILFIKNPKPELLGLL